MKLSPIQNSGIVLLCFLILTGCQQPVENQSKVSILPYYTEATFTPQWLSPAEVAAMEIHAISPFSLVNQDGNMVSDKTMEGKIYVTDFFFTVCPGICPKMTANMGVLQEEFLNDDEIILLSHSVTPEIDSVPVLKAYAEKKGITSGKWHLVTGERQAIYNLGRHEYFVEEDLGLEKEEDDFLHTENFVLVDKNKHIRGIYNGLNKTAINQLIADIHTLKKEK